MKREEALIILKELESTFTTLSSTRYILLKNDDKEDDHWKLLIEWTPQLHEKQLLQNLVTQYSLKIFSKNGQTIFSKIR